MTTRMPDVKDDEDSELQSEKNVAKNCVFSEEVAHMSVAFGEIALDPIESFSTPLKSADSELCAVCLSPLVAEKLNFNSMEHDSLRDDRQIVKTKCQVIGKQFVIYSYRMIFSSFFTTNITRFH